MGQHLIINFKPEQNCYSGLETTERFTALDKLKLLVVHIWLEPIFPTFQLPQKSTFISKGVKINSKTLILR